MGLCLKRRGWISDLAEVRSASKEVCNCLSSGQLLTSQVEEQEEAMNSVDHGRQRRWLQKTQRQIHKAYFVDTIIWRPTNSWAGEGYLSHRSVTESTAKKTFCNFFMQVKFLRHRYLGSSVGPAGISGARLPSWKLTLKSTQFVY